VGPGESRIAAWLLFGGIVLSFVGLTLGIAGRGLFEPTEGRYGSIAAAMARSGDWVVPRLNGVGHFEKPPLAMWAMAAGLRLFGESQGALRLPGSLAALAALVAAYHLGGGRRRVRAVLAALLTLASPLFFGVARAVSTDIYLCGLVALTLLFAARAAETASDRSRSRNLNLAVVCSALGFLTKGPVIWIPTLLPVVVETVWSRGPGALRTLFAPVRLLLFLALVLPWFLLAGIRVPGLLEWFVEARLLGALVSSKGFHHGPVYYYVPVLLAGLLPASLILLCAGRRGIARLCETRTGRLLALAVAIPFVVFSLSASKLATYLLPVAVPASVLAATLLIERPRRTAVLASAGLLALLVVGGAIEGWRLAWFPLLAGTSQALLAGAGAVGLAGSAVGFHLARSGRARAGVVALAAFQLALLFLCVPVATISEAQLTHRGRGADVAAAVRESAPDGVPVVCYRTFLRSLPFYLGRNAILAGWYHEEDLDPAEWEACAVGVPEGLASLVEREPVTVLCQSKRVGELVGIAAGLRPVRTVGKYTILSNVPEVEAGSASPKDPAEKTSG